MKKDTNWVVVKMRLTPENKAELFDLKYANNFDRVDDVITMLLRDRNKTNIEALPVASQKRRKTLLKSFLSIWQ
jgi:hypothetical protein